MRCGQQAMFADRLVTQVADKGHTVRRRVAGDERAMNPYALFMFDSDDVNFGAQIPVFASVPSKLDKNQNASREYIYKELRKIGLSPRTVGGSDKGVYNPLHEVRTLARHCAGGIILGYEQISAKRVFQKTRGPEGTGVTDVLMKEFYSAPTPWNQLETGILFGLGLPLLILKQQGIKGGIFDEGASDVLIQSMPMPHSEKWSGDPGDLQNPDACRNFEATLLRWQGRVRQQYYGD
jgi:hypothetical protein